MIPLTNRTALILIFTGILSIHFISKLSYITDSRWTLQTAWVIAHHKNVQMDQFRQVIEQNEYYAIVERDGHLYYSFPAGTPLLCTPFVIVFEQAAKRFYYLDIMTLLQTRSQGGMETFIAAFFVALTAVFLFLVLQQWKIDDRLIWASVLVFAFGTSAWSTASRGLFAHGPSMLFLIVGVWSLLKAEKNKYWLWLAGFLFGYSYVIRPTNIIPMLVFALYVLWIFRTKSWSFFSSLGAVLILFFAFNYSIYSDFLSPYYQPARIGKEHHLFAGLAGNLFSPSRGLFIFSPFLILLVPLLIASIRSKKLTLLHYTIFGVILTHTLLISYFDSWHGGWCFGPRYFADVIPYLILLLALGLQNLISTGSLFFKRVYFTAFFLLSIISFGINYEGANNIKTLEWNYVPNNIDNNRERLWDWNDIQFMRR